MSWNGVKKQSYDQEIKSWCEEMDIENYTINSQGEIDVDGNVDLSYKEFEELPYKFGTVTGYFSLEECKNLISLENCPNHVNYSFDIDGCIQLDSLEGCPEEVDDNFYCFGCKRNFTKKEIKSLCKVKGKIRI